MYTNLCAVKCIDKSRKIVELFPLIYLIKSYIIELLIIKNIMYINKGKSKVHTLFLQEIVLCVALGRFDSILHFNFFSWYRCANSDGVLALILILMLFRDLFWNRLMQQLCDMPNEFEYLKLFKGICHQKSVAQVLDRGMDVMERHELLHVKHNDRLHLD